MLRGSIEIKTTTVYGNPTIYPACASAQLIANVAGTETLTPSTIAALLRAGVQVHQAFPNGDSLGVDSLDDIVYV